MKDEADENRDEEGAWEQETGREAAAGLKKDDIVYRVAGLENQHFSSVKQAMPIKVFWQIP